MAGPSRQAIVRALLERHGTTFAQELGIDLRRAGPSALFRLLVASLLFSARISQEIATAAARAFNDQGWTSAAKMAQTTWKQRVTTLNRSGYARYDERTATMLGDTVELLQERYRGDLRRLRDEAQRDPARERELLKEFKGIGDVGVDIFFREVQVAWDELVPLTGRRALDVAQRLGLPGGARGLARLVDDADFPALVAALVRVRRERDREEVVEAARRG